MHYAMRRQRVLACPLYHKYPAYAECRCRRRLCAVCLMDHRDAEQPNDHLYVYIMWLSVVFTCTAREILI